MAKGKGSGAGRPRNPMRIKLQEGLEERIPKFFEKLDQIEDAKDWIDAYSKGFPYVMARLQTTKLETEEGGKLKVNVQYVSPGK